MQQQFDEGVDSWKSVMFLYNSALKEVSTKLEILNDEFQYVHQYNPIEYIKSRIKSPESIVKKIKKNGYESSIQNMVNYVNDMQGIPYRLLLYIRHLPDGGDDRKAERSDRSVYQRLYQESKTERL